MAGGNGFAATLTFNVEIGRGGALRQPPPLAPARRWANVGWARAVKILESAERDGSLNLLLKRAAFPIPLAVFSCAREGPSASGLIGGAGADLSGRLRHDPIETAGRGGLWRVCSMAFPAG